MKDKTNFETLIQKSSDLCVVIDQDDKVEFANKAVLNSLEVDLELLIKKGIATYFHPEDVKKMKNVKEKIMSNPGVSFLDRVRFISSTGKIRSYESNCTFDPDSKKIIMLNRDLTNIISHEGMYDQAKRLANIGLWEYSIDNKSLYWDDVVYDIYELNRGSEINFDRMKKFFREDSLAYFNEAIERTVSSGAPLDLELNFISGKFRPSTARYVGKLVSGEVNKIVGTIQNLTDLRKLERTSEDYKEAVDKSAIVSITDRDGIITEVNEKFLQLTKYKREELIGYSHRKVSSGFHPQEFWTNVWETISSGKVWSGEIKNKDKLGKALWVSTTIIPFKNSMGRNYQYLAIQTDITENKKLTEEIMVSEKLSAVGEISAQILHEVMTPLSIISLSIENLEDDVCELKDKEDAKSIQTSLDEIKSNYDKIEEIFQNMRSILVTKSGADTETISIKETFDKSLSLVKAKLTSKDISIDLNQFKDFMVHCSRSELSQVFLNLINNSCDAIMDLEQRWIEIETKADENDVVILFKDSGTGMSDEVKERIFENLFTTKGDTKGTGLGMGVCKKLIERYNGSIRVASEFPTTTFEIKLPRIKSEN